jgi:hypothetical protein
MLRPGSLSRAAVAGEASLKPPQLFSACHGVLFDAGLYELIRNLNLNMGNAY